MRRRSRLADRNGPLRQQSAAATATIAAMAMPAAIATAGGRRTMNDTAGQKSDERLRDIPEPLVDCRRDARPTSELHFETEARDSRADDLVDRPERPGCGQVSGARQDRIGVQDIEDVGRQQDSHALEVD